MGVIGEDEDPLVSLGRAAVQQLLRCPQAILKVVGALLWCAAHSLLKLLLCTEPMPMLTTVNEYAHIAAGASDRMVSLLLVQKHRCRFWQSVEVAKMNSLCMLP